MQLPKIDVKREALATILNEIRSGSLQVPRFQREFVWSLSKTRALLDSIYKEFPIGAFFLWRAPDGIPPLARPLEELGVEKSAPGAKVSYILDGQQRLTSLYCAVNGIRLGMHDYGRISIDLETAMRFDNNREEDFQDDIFVYRVPDNKRYVAVSDLLGTSALMLINDIPLELKPAFYKISGLFQTYPFSVVWIQEQTLADAIDIFQRINQAGQRLSRYDLVCANLWREDFDFRKLVSNVNEDLERRGFGQIDETIFTQTFAMIEGDQCTTLAELSLKTDQVKSKWEAVVRALGLAIEFAVNNLGVMKAEFLPYRGQLVVLAYYFYHRGDGAITVKERKILWEWFWRVTLAERYSSTSPMRMAEDAKKMRAFLNGEETVFGYMPVVNLEKLLDTKMSSTTSALRNGFLCMLALKQPRNFKDNSPINLRDPFFSNLKQTERHHVFPVGYLKTHAIAAAQVNLLPNFCFIPADLNKEIGSKSPAQYLEHYRSQNPAFETAIATHLIPTRGDSPVWKNNAGAFETFLSLRAQVLLDELIGLIDIGPGGLQPVIETIAPVNEVDLLEVRIRDFIDARLTAVVGKAYWKPTMPGDVITLVKERIADHLSKHPYLEQSEFASGRTRLDFCDVSDYEKIFMKNWNIFSEQFQNKPSLTTHMTAFRNLRNCIQHNRKPTAVEEKNGEAAMIWLKGILDKADQAASAVDDNGDVDLEPVIQPAKSLEAEFEQAGLGADETVEAAGQEPAGKTGNKRKWSEERYFKAIQGMPPETQDVIKNLYGWVQQKADRLWFGTGIEKGSFTFHYLVDGKTVSIFSIYTDALMVINYGWILHQVGTELADAFRQEVTAIPAFSRLRGNMEGWPYVRIGETLVGRPDDVRRFKTLVENFGQQIHGGEKAKNLEAEFEHTMRGTYEAARQRGYVATYFIQMLEEHGGVETAKRLLAKSEPQAGLFNLWELGLLKDSMEALVLQDRFKPLFSEGEIAEARRRLDELGYFKK